MLAKVFKYLRISKYFIRVHFFLHTMYRLSFFTALIGKILRGLILIVFFYAIYLNIPAIGEWNFNEILVLIATYLTIEAIIVMTFHRNLFYYFPRDVKRGDFDFSLVKPVNTLFITSFKVFDVFDLFSHLPLIYFWYYIFVNTSLVFAWQNILLFILLLLNSVVFIYAITLIIASTSFWTINSTGLGRFFENLLQTSRYPTTIYSRGVKLGFDYILPITIIATFPSQVLLGQNNWPYFTFALFFSIILLVIAISFWRFALKHYSSASS